MSDPRVVSASDLAGDAGSPVTRRLETAAAGRLILHIRQ